MSEPRSGFRSERSMRRPNSTRAKALAELIGRTLGTTVARQGFSGADIILSWPEIAGERLATASQPIRLDWPRRRDPAGAAEPAALVIRVESAFALELQHLAPLILERVNAFYGWRCVSRLVLKQGPVRSAAKRHLEARALTPEERARVDGSVAGVDEAALKGALERLGRAVMAAGPDTAGDQDGTPVPQS